MSRWGPWRAAERRLGRIVAVARIETLRLIRDRVAISLIALVPVVQIVLFGYAVNLDPKNVRIAIAGSDVSSVERAARIVGETGYFRIAGLGVPPGAAEMMAAECQRVRRRGGRHRRRERQGERSRRSDDASGRR